MKRTIFLIVALSFAATIYPQDIPKINYENPRVKRPLGLSLNLGGPTYVAAASLDCFLLPVLNIEAGGGIWGYYLGPKYHFNGYNKNNKTTLYTGILFTVYPSLDLGPSWGNRNTSYGVYGVYVPIGLNTVSKTGYTFSIEIAYNSMNKQFTSFPLWFSLKWGYHFKSRNDKIANK